MVETVKEFIAIVLKNPRLSMFNEEQTKMSLIAPLLAKLGWSVFNDEEVVLEFPIGADKVDYALRIDNSSKVYIEAKRCSIDLDNPRWQEQLLKYAFQAGVQLAILTNGITWWFYLPLREGDWEQRKFYSIDLTQQSPEDIATRFVEFLSKENVISGKAIEKAETVISGIKRARVVKRTLPKAWNSLLSEQDGLLVDLLEEKVENLCGFSPTKEELIAFLRKVREERGVEPVVPSRSSTSRSTTRPKPSEDRVEGRFYTLDQIRQVPLTSTKPNTLLIGEDSFDVRSWAELSESFVEWLVDKGLINQSHLPVYSYSHRDKYFINDKPSHENPERNGEWREVRRYFVDIKFNAKGHIKNLEAALNHIGLADPGIKISL